MSAQDDNSQMINRRSALLGIGGLGAFSTLAGRLYYLQVVRAEDYKVLSDNNRFNFNTVMPDRGQILDRNGIALAMNKQDFRLVLIPERVKDIDGTLARINAILPLGQSTRRRIKRDINSQAKFIPVLVDEQIDWQTFSRLNIKMPDLPGVIPFEGKARNYPQHGTFAHVLGYVGKPSPQALKNDKDPLMRQPTFRMGKTGIEQSYDQQLRGKAGRKKVEVNAVGRIVREWDDDKISAIAGKDVWLTLDSELQSYGAELFKDESGGVAVMDVATGELRTLLSMPIFDNNLFVSGLSNAQFKALDTDPKRPQFNKVIGGGYPPASTFKMVVMLAALAHKVIDPKDKIFCTGKTFIGNRDFHCWRRRGHGLVNMHEALKQSCDVYFYEIIQRLGMDKVKPFAEKLGLGQVFNLGLGGQIRGIVPDPSWKQDRLGTKWRTGDSLNAAIGQGFVLTTPLQLTVMTARLANAKMAVSPLLVVGDKIEQVQALDINPDHMAIVQKAMRAVCEEPGGTAYMPNGLGLLGIELAGKTGTGQVRGISTAERLSGVRNNAELPWKLRDHSIFVGYAPYENPRFAAGVLVEHGGSGARLAANICRKILGRALERDGIGAIDNTIGEN
ncbi:MAG: penicillin-binding protein 2 [Robiginitomaculum sp.]|nr:MAG: penicillin-binding protein 2 [Robiginitomaculum sp.]